MPLLPLDTLQVLAQQLDAGDLEQALLLLKLLIVLCRWGPVVLPKMGGGGAVGQRAPWHIAVTSPIGHSPGTWRTWMQAGARCWRLGCWPC